MIDYNDAIQNYEYCKQLLLEEIEGLKIAKSHAEITLAQFDKTMGYLNDKYESPIERIFGNSLITCLYMAGYMVFPISYLILSTSKETVKSNEEKTITALVEKMNSVMPVLYISAQTVIKSKERIDLCLFCVPQKQDDLHSLAIELDGYEYHKGRFIADRKKDRHIRSNGYEDVYRFSGSEIVGNAPEALTDVLNWVKQFNQ